MALTEDRVREALRPVLDPELHLSIVDLNMVKGIRVKRGQVTVTVALTVPGCPMRTEITQRVTDAVRPLEGVMTWPWI
jgi:ATP-binding protein involved in chromosome partitioning